MHPSAVLFDFDGVIVSSLGVHIKAWELAHQDIFQRPMTPEQRVAIVGRSTTAIAQLLAEAIDARRATALADRKKALLQTMHETILPLPGVEETFRYLNEKKIPFGIASNAPRHFVQRTLAHLGLEVKVSLGYEDVQRPKPAPDLYLLCAKRLGVSVSEHHRCLVFEDSTHGLEAGKAAGMIPVGVMTQHSAEILTQAGAQKICANLEEALAKDFFAT